MANEQNSGNDIWAMLASILLPQLLGGNKAQPTTQQQVVATPPRGYQDPMIGVMSPTIWDMLLRNLQGLGGAGMPGGSNFLSPSIQKIIDYLGRLTPDLLEGYNKTPSQVGIDRRLTARQGAGTQPISSTRPGR